MEDTAERGLTSRCGHHSTLCGTSGRKQCRPGNPTCSCLLLGQQHCGVKEGLTEERSEAAREPKEVSKEQEREMQEFKARLWRFPVPASGAGHGFELRPSGAVCWVKVRIPAVFSSGR